MQDSNHLFLGMNCEKNAVVCECYHEKQIWKSGKEKAEEGTFPSMKYRRILLLTIAPERLRQEALPIITMQPIFHGVETVEDRSGAGHAADHVLRRDRVVLLEVRTIVDLGGGGGLRGGRKGEEKCEKESNETRHRGLLSDPALGHWQGKPDQPGVIG